MNIPRSKNVMTSKTRVGRIAFRAKRPQFVMCKQVPALVWGFARVSWRRNGDLGDAHVKPQISAISHDTTTDDRGSRLCCDACDFVAFSGSQIVGTGDNKVNACGKGRELDRSLPSSLAIFFHVRFAFLSPLSRSLEQASYFVFFSSSAISNPCNLKSWVLAALTKVAISLFSVNYSWNYQSFFRVLSFLSRSVAKSSSAFQWNSVLKSFILADFFFFLNISDHFPLSCKMDIDASFLMQREITFSPFPLRN